VAAAPLGGSEGGCPLRGVGGGALLAPLHQDLGEVLVAVCVDGGPGSDRGGGVLPGGRRPSWAGLLLLRGLLEALHDLFVDVSLHEHVLQLRVDFLEGGSVEGLPRPALQHQLEYLADR
jgi:hypothetical protein